MSTSTTPIRIGTLGTGRMAYTLGKLWAARGHPVFFGSREPRRAGEFAASLGANVKGGTQAEALAFGEIVLLAVPWTAAEETVKALGPWEGKILVDMTNPVKPAATGMQLAMGYTESAGESVARWAPDAKVVKAFNSIYFENLERPAYGYANASTFFCGDDAQAKAVVARLSREIGFDPVDSGPLKNARLLEPLAVLWMQLSSLGHGADIAFALLKRT